VQAFPRRGVFVNVETLRRRQYLRLLESVRCLDCGEIYSKPVGGGTVEENPGCPLCGYVGWLSVTLPRRARRRSVAGPLLRLSAR
jgi:hypothetical protein